MRDTTNPDLWYIIYQSVTHLTARNVPEKWIYQ
jgi:hypothetical protein